MAGEWCELFSRIRRGVVVALSISWTCPEDGTYYLFVLHYDEADGLGEYRLSIEVAHWPMVKGSATGRSRAAALGCPGDSLAWSVDGVGYDLTVGREGGGKSYVSWRITEAEDDAANLSITIYPYALQKIPLVIRWAPHLAMMRPALHSYLESVLKGFEWFITTGKPVTKNQFGSHKWFSNNKN